MNKLLVMTTLLLFASCCTKADDQDSALQPQAYLAAALSEKLNLTYQLTAKEGAKDERPDNKEHTNSLKKTLTYQHNQPKVIDDPLPMKVDYMQPIAIEFISDSPYKPIFKGVLIMRLFFNIYGVQPLKEEIDSPNNVANAHEKKDESNTTNTNAISSLKAINHDIKAENSIESKRYVKNPNKIDVVSTNNFAEPLTKDKLFNSQDDIVLSGAPPEVIFKPGDDITFIHDATVLDDYEHMPHEEKLDKNKKSSISTRTTTPLPPTVKELNKNKKSTPFQRTKANTRNNKPPLRASQTTDDKFSSAAATNHLTTIEKIESSHSGHGYVYDKPKIPFTF